MSPAEALPGLNLPGALLTTQRAVLGVDPSTRRMSAAVLVPAAERELHGTFVVSTLSLPQPERDEALRLALAQAAMVSWLGELLTRWEPEVVAVESPFAHGRLVPVESFHVIGVLLAVLGTYGARVVRLNPGQWKRAALGAGFGGVKKPKRGEAFEYAVLTWARAAGYLGSLDDEADAMGIAAAAGVMLAADGRN